MLAARLALGANVNPTPDSKVRVFDIGPAGPMDPLIAGHQNRHGQARTHKEAQMAINTGKVITGGLLAGVVFNVLDMLFNFTVLASDNMEMVNRLNLDPAVATSFSYGVPWIVIDFVFGLLVVWTYAAMRPRFGPGPKTALLAGMVPYVAVLVVLLGFTTMGVFAMTMFLKNMALAAITVAAGSVAGAWAYKED